MIMKKTNSIRTDERITKIPEKVQCHSKQSALAACSEVSERDNRFLKVTAGSYRTSITGTTIRV